MPLTRRRNRNVCCLRIQNAVFSSMPVLPCERRVPHPRAPTQPVRTGGRPPSLSDLRVAYDSATGHFRSQSHADQPSWAGPDRGNQHRQGRRRPEERERWNRTASPSPITLCGHAWITIQVDPKFGGDTEERSVYTPPNHAGVGGTTRSGFGKARGVVLRGARGVVLRGEGIPVLSHRYEIQRLVAIGTTRSPRTTLSPRVRAASRCGIDGIDPETPDGVSLRVARPSTDPFWVDHEIGRSARAVPCPFACMASRGSGRK